MAVFRIRTAAQAVIIDGDDFSGIHFPDKSGSQRIHRASLAADDIALSQAADGQGTQAMLVPAGIDAVARHNQEGERAVNHIQRFFDSDDAGTVRIVVFLADEMGQNFTIGG